MDVMAMSDEEGNALGLKSQEAEQPARRGVVLQGRAHCEGQDDLLEPGKYQVLACNMSPGTGCDYGEVVYEL